MNILEFRSKLGGHDKGGSWAVWESVLKGVYALEMTEGDRHRLFEVAHRSPPERPVRQLWVKAGRGSGKTETGADIASYQAVCRDYSAVLSRGEFATCMLLAADREQAKVALDRVRGLFRHSPTLRRMVDKETVSGLELSNQARIEIHTSSYRSVRGRSLACVVLDEVAFWKDETTSNPDVEVYTAVLPGLARVPGSLLVGISTPHRRAGLLWDMYDRHFGREDSADVLFVEGGTELFNPTLDPAVIQAARDADPVGAASEWDAAWRSDLESFVDRAVVESLVVSGRHELAPTQGIKYLAGVDPAGGSGADGYGLAVAHHDPETGRAVLDAVRCQRPPFSPESTTKEFADLLRWYDIGEVRGDRFAGAWPREAFSKHGINYVPAEKSKSDYYINLLPHLNSGRVELLDNPHLVSELCGLERRSARGGRDSVDHAPRQHDDAINAAAICLVEAARPPFNPGADAFWSAGDSVACELRELAGQGVTGTTALSHISVRHSPWSSAPSYPRPGPFVV